MKNKFIFILGIMLCPSVFLFSQKSRGIEGQHCATMDRLTAKFISNPTLKTNYLNKLDAFNQVMQARLDSAQKSVGSSIKTNNIVYTIPIVFHIVLPDPYLVTDTKIIEQLRVLNESFAGNAPDSIGIPGYFKPLFGKSKIQFCLAQRTPDGYPTSGIDRVTTTKTSFSVMNDNVKHTLTGGVDIWDDNRYLNVWVCILSNNILGYGTFPTEGDRYNQGVVINYHSMPGGVFANFNGGKTLTHEIGHYFNLYHIWGDDNGACTGSDYVDDTPNQSGATSGCYTIKTDACTPGGSGTLFQDYMDYSNDQCLLLFTPNQSDRMETALLTYRPYLLTSNSCTPAVVNTLDVHLRNIVAPAKRICTNTFSPGITIRNKGTQVLKSIIVTTVIDNGVVANYTWAGNLSPLDTVTINMNSLLVAEGMHSLKFFISKPNGGIDEDLANDTISTTLEYYSPVHTINESFEGNTFPPAGWDIINLDGYITWKKITGAAKTGVSSVMINTFNYSNEDQQDYLRTPELDLTNIDSAFLTFQVAASTYTSTSTVGNTWDTLEILVSKDCGFTYNSLYKKWGATLITVGENTNFFTPTTSNQWRKDSINLTPYINNSNVMIVFRSTNEFENNIYLDDIRVKSVTISPNLKQKGFLITPNPTKNSIQIQFYPSPDKLKSIQLFNSSGQKLNEVNILGVAPNSYIFDISSYPKGVYVVSAFFADKILVKKIVKQ